MELALTTIASVSSVFLHTLIFLLQLTQRHWSTSCHTKCRVKGFSECAVEGVEVDQCVRGHSVEGHNATSTVQIHCYSVRRGGCMSVIVADRITIPRADQPPGLIIVSNPWVVPLSLPTNSFIRHCYVNLTFPLKLIVTAINQSICTQHLITVIKPLWVVRIWLLPKRCSHLCVVVRKLKLSVSCAWIQCEFTGIWWITKHNAVAVYV